MTNQPATWPLAPGEHPDLPRLHLELHAATPATRTSPAQPACARILFSPLPVLTTANPDRLRTLANALEQLATDLEHAHTLGTPGQQTLDTKAH